LEVSWDILDRFLHHAQVIAVTAKVIVSSSACGEPGKQLGPGSFYFAKYDYGGRSIFTALRPYWPHGEEVKGFVNRQKIWI
jgi:hypothetical protein